jgi:tripartite-type tricarboxylate transporter receptor subunit TctC
LPPRWKILARIVSIIKDGPRSSLVEEFAMSLVRRLALMVLTLAAWPAFAQTWPSSAIRMVVPFAAGGATDALARIIAGKLQEQLGVAVIVDNKAGAGGNLGANVVAKSAPDGYTILFNINGQAISPALYRSLPYDADKDFVRITQLVSTTSLLVVAPSLPVDNLAQLVAYAKAHPGVLNYGSTGVGTSLHLTMEMLKHETGMDILMVPFRGDAPLFAAMFGGEVQVAIAPMITAKTHIDAGALRAIAVTTAKRAPTMPNTPTIAEQGVAGFDVPGWMGLFAPAGTPRLIVERLWLESQRALAAPDVIPVLRNLAMDAVGSSPDEFDKRYFADRETFRRVVKNANIPLQD